MTTNSAHRIVVGVDGSPASREALRWAASEAEIRGVPLEVVGVWSFPTYVDPMGTTFATPSMLERTEANEKQMIEDEVAAVLDGSCTAPITKTLRCGSTSAELLDAAKGADLLVIGSRGRGGFLSLLLGSTAMHCVQHASVPVVVVRVPGSS